MPEKVNKKKEIKTNSDVFEIYLGTFDDDVFTWYSIEKFKDPTQAYKEFKKYVNTQLKYTDEELKKVWDTGRLDIELRQGNKLLNWVGIYSREVKELSKAEEKEAEEGKVKKDSKLTPTEIFLKEFCSDEIHDSDKSYFVTADSIEFMPNGKQDNMSKVSFGEGLSMMGLDEDEVTEIYSPEPTAVKKHFDKLAKYIVKYYLPQNDFRFKDSDLEFGDNIVIIFNGAKLIDNNGRLIATVKKPIRFEFENPYSRDEDLYYKSTGETVEQTMNKYN